MERNQNNRKRYIFETDNQLDEAMQMMAERSIPFDYDTWIRLAKLLALNQLTSKVQAELDGIGKSIDHLAINSDYF